MQETCYEWSMFEEEKAANLIATSDMIFDQLLEEIAKSLATDRLTLPYNSDEAEIQHFSVNSSLSEF